MKLTLKPLNKNLLIGILCVLVVALFLIRFIRINNLSIRGLPGWFLQGQSVSSPLESDEYIRVKGVDDGDTIVLENGETIRYLGIDTPELHHTELGEECGAKEAKEANEKLVAGKRVRLEKDMTDKDQYGRLLRFVFTEDGEFVNYSIIRQGYAQVLSIPPDNKFEKVFLDAQLTAKRENLGIWKNCFK